MLSCRPVLARLRYACGAGCAAGWLPAPAFSARRGRRQLERFRLPRPLLPRSVRPPALTDPGETQSGLQCQPGRPTDPARPRDRTLEFPGDQTRRLPHRGQPPGPGSRTHLRPRTRHDGRRQRIHPGPQRPRARLPQSRGRRDFPTETPRLTDPRLDPDLPHRHGNARRARSPKTPPRHSFRPSATRPSTH